MELLESKEMQCIKEQLQEVIKPYQQEQNRRQKKADFLKKCVQCLEKNDFFQLDDLLKGKPAKDILEDAQFASCESLFCQLQEVAREEVDRHYLSFTGTLLGLAEQAGLPLEVRFPQLSFLKGIEGSVDFPKRTTLLNQITLKSIDPKRIIAAALGLKRKLYDSPFEPKKFIDGLFQCYQENLKKEGRPVGETVPVQQLYQDYVWSLQSKTFFQNMDKVKFKGYSVEQFAVDLWRFFTSDASAAEGGYFMKLNPGRGKSLWLIDQLGERRAITHVQFTKQYEVVES